MKKLTYIVLICLLKFSNADDSFSVHQIEATLNTGEKVLIKPTQVERIGDKDPPKSDKGSSFKSDENTLEISGYSVSRWLPIEEQAKIMKQWPFVVKLNVQSVPGKVEEAAREKVCEYNQRMIQTVDEKITFLRKFLEEFRPYEPVIKDTFIETYMELSRRLGERAEIGFLTTDQRADFLREAISYVERGIREGLINLTQQNAEFNFDHLKNLKRGLAYTLLRSYLDSSGNLPPLDPKDPKVQESRSLLEWSAQVGVESAQGDLQTVLDKIKAFEQKAN